MHQSLLRPIQTEETLGCTWGETIHLQGRWMQQGVPGQIQTEETSTGPYQGKTLRL